MTSTPPVFFRRLAAALSLLLLAFVAAMPAAFAQETTAAVQGIVTDPTGAVVPNATVTATSSSLIKPASTTTDSHGFYRLNALPPGSYAITVNGGGMSFKATQLKLSAATCPTSMSGSRPREPRQSSMSARRWRWST